MSDFALMVFEPEEKNQKSLTGLLFRIGFFKSRIGSGIYFLLRKKDFSRNILKASVDEKLDALIIKLPFAVSRLRDFNNRFIDKFIRKTCRKWDTPVCYMPSGCSSGYKPSFASSVSGRLRTVIFKSLLLPILDEIYTKSGLHMGAVDIAVFPGNDREELFTVVKLLEPRIRFITIAAQDKEPFEDGLAEITDETGLSIGISSDYKKILKNAQLIINFGDTAAISRFRMNPKSLVVNFHEKGRPAISGENTVINGVEYELPESIRSSLGRDVLRSYVRKELADIYICHKLGLGSDTLDEKVEERVVGLFNDKGIRIIGFTGRRGVLKVENVLKAVRM